MKKQLSADDKQSSKTGFNYCRKCYKHLAGYVGVAIAEALEDRGFLKRNDTIYLVTKNGWDWFSQFNIYENDFTTSRRPLTRQCIDVSERKPHLAGHLGDVLLEKMLDNGWFENVQSSRELLVTEKGRQSLHEHLGIDITA